MADNTLDRCLGLEPGCSPFQLTKDTNANKLINSLVNESLTIGGADINVYKLLGIHEQFKLVDLTGTGIPISSGDNQYYPASNAFNDDPSEWRSIQKGSLIPASSYIGYDFGAIKLDNGRLRYGIDTEVKYHIVSVMLQQGCDSKNRVSKVRVERSDNGSKWYGVDIITITDSSNQIWYNIKQSAPARYWRIRPLIFNGTDNDFWTVNKISLSEYVRTDITNIQDEMGFMENRDRSYSIDPIKLKGYYDLQDVQTDLTRFGFDLKNQYFFKIGFDSIIRSLGRPIVIGDIIELPSEVQYDNKLRPVKKFLEVTDVSWASSGFTPGYQPTLYTVTAQPMIASQETQDIVGDLNIPSSDNEFYDMFQNHYSPENTIADQKIREEADTQVPERGTDTANEAYLPEDLVLDAYEQGLNLRKLSPYGLVYIEDGMPPNGLPYTEGPTFPSNPTDGVYHRLTYINTPEPIPTRLYQYSVVKLKWMFKEEDKRMRMNSTKPQYEQFLNTESQTISPDKIR
jgi:hypothetical protein